MQLSSGDSARHGSTGPCDPSTGVAQGLRHLRLHPGADWPGYGSGGENGPLIRPIVAVIPPKARVAVVRHERISVRRPNTKSLRQADISCTDNFIIFKKQSKACCGSKTARDFLNLGGVISNVAPPNTITRATTWFKRSLICAGWQFGIHYRGQRIPKRPNPWEEAECRT